MAGPANTAPGEDGWIVAEGWELPRDYEVARIAIDWGARVVIEFAISGA